MPGAQRPLNETNIKLALTIARACLPDLLSTLWALHPVRTSLMILLHIVRGFFPAFRGYSQAMIVDEVSQPNSRAGAVLIVCSCSHWSLPGASPGRASSDSSSPRYLGGPLKQRLIHLRMSRISLTSAVH